MIELASTKTEAMKDREALKSLRFLSGFIGLVQLRALRDGLQCEERQFFLDKIAEIENIILTMPKTYEQDGLGEKAIAYLHYFRGNQDWYITEKDKGTAEETGQHQAFGLAELGNYPFSYLYTELGYISIVEIIKANVELDLYWGPKTIEKIKENAS